MKQNAAIILVFADLWSLCAVPAALPKKPNRTPPWRGIPEWLLALYSARTARHWLRGAVAFVSPVRSNSGTRRPARRRPRSRVTRVSSARWRSAPMERRSLRGKLRLHDQALGRGDWQGSCRHEGPHFRRDSLVFTADGKTLISGSRDKTIKLWDVATESERATLKGHTAHVKSVALSPDGKTLASWSGDGTIRLWDLATGTERANIKGQTGYVSNVTFSPDGKMLAAGSGENAIKLWDAATGKEQTTFKGHTSNVTSVTFSPDGKSLASGSADCTVKLWSIATGKEIVPA